ncbi:hypothetical protein J6590_026696 [Homalodisca vitripennis]|nr:hypothetical protein J6590_026696 [Homalodisca vitripennis]
MDEFGERKMKCFPGHRSLSAVSTNGMLVAKGGKRGVNYPYITVSYIFNSAGKSEQGGRAALRVSIISAVQPPKPGKDKYPVPPLYCSRFGGTRSASPSPNTPTTNIAVPFTDTPMLIQFSVRFPPTHPLS